MPWLTLSSQLNQLIPKELNQLGNTIMTGVQPGLRPFLVPLLNERSESIIWLTPTNDSAIRLADDLNSLSIPHLLYPERSNEQDPLDPLQMECLAELQRQPQTTLILSVQALLQPTISVEELRNGRVDLEVGSDLERSVLQELLEVEGFQRVSLVERFGEYAVRGDIIDVYPLTGDPIRIELFDDVIESIRVFDRDTQRSLKTLERTEIFPAQSSDRTSYITEIIPEKSLVIQEEPNQLRLHSEEQLHQHKESGWIKVEELLANRLICELSAWETPEQNTTRTTCNLAATSAPVFPKRVPEFLGKLPSLLEEYSQILICSPQSHRLKNLIINDQGFISSQIEFTNADLSRGFIVQDLICLTDRELTGTRLSKRVRAKANRASLLRLDEMKPGQLIVHLQHGIGRYLGTKTLKIQGFQRDFIQLDYAGTDSLFLPAHQLDLIEPYQGLEERVPKLSKLGGNSWNKTKAKVIEKADEMAEELLKLYAQRELSVGFSFTEDTPWQKELEDSFPYQETRDQLTVIQAVKEDMESPRAMDRLVCGDVGFGKTEVAIRAAFKAVQSGKQVAVLAPTTILAHQHYQTFATRLATFPCRIELLSRFQTAKETKNIQEGLTDGSIDIIVGTHKLLNDKVKFKDLGLLVVDEEQKFGVKQKEKLKQFKANVDILTLTATPIPRSLNMAMISIRDLSVIETPPEDRMPIKTYLFENNPKMVQGAIEREIARGGQVFFIHNRIQGLERLAQDIRRNLPEDIIVKVAHGQLTSTALENLMFEFVEGEFDVLVCTSIIESGIDVPNANTIIINNAHHFGLSQLYQMRGRVGRSARQAYCYLLHPEGRELNDTAQKRLETIRDFTQLGAGFQIAMRDLEIRGSGDVLGKDQSGHIASVGFELYCKLLKEAVNKHKVQEQQPALESTQITLDLPVTAVLPDSYIEEQTHKVAMYQKLSKAQTEEELALIEEELVDRYGRYPEEVENLLSLFRLRFQARRSLVHHLKVHEGQLVTTLLFHNPPSMKQLNKLFHATEGWKPEFSPPTLTLHNLFGNTPGKTEYPPDKELLEKVFIVLKQVENWIKEE